MPMLYTADVVAKRYSVSRERQDEYALQSQQRTAAAQSRRTFRRRDRADGVVEVRAGSRDGAVERRSGRSQARTKAIAPIRRSPDLAALKGAVPGVGDSTITAGNSSQLSDGAAAVVDGRRRVCRAPQSASRSAFIAGYAVAATRAGRDGNRSGVSPCPKLLKQHGLTVDDIGLWELNEAFAVQTVYCRETLGIPNDRFNVDGGAISIGHPYGMSGHPHDDARADRGQAPRRANTSSSRCASAGGMGAAALFEVA